MNFILTTLTIITIAICGPEKNTITEDVEVQKPSQISKETVVTYKKVPTKWVKTTKKSN